MGILKQSNVPTIPETQIVSICRTALIFGHNTYSFKSENKLFARCSHGQKNNIQIYFKEYLLYWGAGVA
jgi:hypothetical protein